MIRIMESVNETVPEWIRSSRDYEEFIRQANKRGIDLYNAPFVTIDPPTSSRSPILNDISKLVVFGVEDDPQLGSSPRIKIYSPSVSLDMDPYLLSVGKNCNKLSWKAILGLTKYCGYYDLTANVKKDPELLKQRARAKSGDANLDRNKHKQKKYSDGNWYSDDEGRVKYDKSGYAIPNPAEVLGRLYDPANSSWDNVAKDIYARIMKVNKSAQSKINEIADDKWSYTITDKIRYYYSALSNTIEKYNIFLDMVKAYDKAMDKGAKESTLEYYQEECDTYKVSALKAIKDLENYSNSIR